MLGGGSVAGGSRESSVSGPVGMVPHGGLLSGRPTPTTLPNWLTEADIDFYVREFERTGFRGGLNWYRNIDRNWERTETLDDRKLEMPALFIAGTRDSTMQWMSPEVMQGRVTDLRTELVDGAGHWLQQERPDE